MLEGKSPSFNRQLGAVSTFATISEPLHGADANLAVRAPSGAEIGSSSMARGYNATSPSAASHSKY